MNDDSFAQVRSQISLSDYLASEVGSNLTHRGNGRYSTACPIHGGDNPSAFSIDDDKGVWKCFTQCGEGGDIFTLWMRLNDSTSLRDALVALAEYGGVQLPEREHKVNDAAIARALRDGAQVFHDTLMGTRGSLPHAPGGDEAFDWITAECGMDDDDLIEAQVGFVPDSPHLVDDLIEAAGSRAALVAAGILRVAQTSGRTYCPFAGRIVFPIRSADGYVIGFGGRAVPGVSRDESPKFVNTHQTDTYDKSRALYGSHLIDGDTHTVYVCEGYMDAIAVNRVRREGVVGVAACGTSVTKQHVESLGDRLGPNGRVVFMADGDEAGLKSMARLVDAAEALGPRGFGILWDETDGKDAWEAYNDGKLASILATAEPSPLLEAALRALHLVVDDNDTFDIGVADDIAAARNASFADDVLRTAARLRQTPISEYGEMLRRHEVSQARRSDKAADLSPGTRALVTRMMGAPPAELRGLAAAVERVSDDVEHTFDRWFPSSRTGLDRGALMYALFPRAERYDRDIIQAVADCVPADDASLTAWPVIAAMMSLVTAEGAKLSRDLPQVTIDRLMTLRDARDGSVSADDELVSLAFALDIASELDTSKV